MNPLTKKRSLENKEIEPQDESTEDVPEEVELPDGIEELITIQLPLEDGDLICDICKTELSSVQAFQNHCKKQHNTLVKTKKRPKKEDPKKEVRKQKKLMKDKQKRLPMNSATDVINLMPKDLSLQERGQFMLNFISQKRDDKDPLSNQVIQDLQKRHEEILPTRRKEIDSSSEVAPDLRPSKIEKPVHKPMIGEEKLEKIIQESLLLHEMGQERK